MRGDVNDLDVVGDNIFFETFGDGGSEAGFEIEEEFVLEREDVEVADHLAFGGDECGVAALAGAEFFDVVGDLAVKEAGAVGAEEAEASAKAEVEHAGGVAQGGVFGGDVAVVGDGIGGVHGGELGVEAGVQFVERQRHGGRVRLKAKGRQAAAGHETN